jgi:hypothetical protein
MGAERLGDHLFRGVLAMQLHPRQVEATEAVLTMQVPGAVDRGDIGRRRSQPGKPRRIEERDERLDIGRRLVRRHAPTGGRHRQDVEAGVEEGDRQRNGIVDAGIDVQDQLARQRWHPDFGGDGGRGGVG